MYNLFLDTNGYSEMRRGSEKLKEILHNTHLIYLNSIVVGELLAGFLYGSHMKKILKNFKIF